MPSANAFLIDGTAYAYRAFYAIPALSTADGRPTNAVYGVAVMVNALRKHRRPDYLAVALDAGKPTLRHQRYEGYKVSRKPMPDALISQLPRIHELVAAHRVPLFQEAGYEAEDLLATIARQIARPGVEVFLVTGDKDALQLVGPQVKVYNPQKGDAIFDARTVEERYGVPPERMVDLMALMGDQIDDIPGVPGIGEKTASALLKRFGTLEGLYQRLDEVDSESLRTALQDHREQVELARELARINAQAPITVELEELAAREPDWTALRRLYRQLGFKRLLGELDAQHPAAPTERIQVHLVRDVDTAKPLAEALASHEPAAIMVSGERLAIAWKPEDAWLVHLQPDAGRAGERAWLRPVVQWLADDDRPKLGHDLKRAVHSLRALGLELAGLAGDTMIAAHLINPSVANRSLADTAEEWLEVRLPPLPSFDRLRTALSNVEGPPAETLSDAVGATAVAHHVCTILPLAQTLSQELERAGLERLYREVEVPLIRVLAEMEAAGVALDQDQLASLQHQIAGRLLGLTKEISGSAGTEFNLNSPRQLAEVLFDRLKLPVIKRGKTGPSTDSEVLQRLAGQHPLPQKLLEYRELTKLASTYVEALPQLINPKTGRLHTSFHQTGTATGRLSSSEPNLQNIPVKTELGRQIRKAIVPGERGWWLLAADYSQIELRILGHLAQDAELMRAFHEDRDVHCHTASLIYGVAEDAVAPEQRSAAKTINFGILYGMSAHGLSKELHIPHDEAAAFIEAYFQRYPGVRSYLDSQIQQARSQGYVQTLLGRRRYIPEINHPDGAMRQFGERMAINAPVQGSAADVIKLAMLRLAEAIRRGGLEGRMILQVHDELVFEAPAKERQALSRLVREVMEHVLDLAVPLRVTVKQGPNWLDMTELSESVSSE